MYYIFKGKKFWTGQGFSKDAANTKFFDTSELVVHEYNNTAKIGIDARYKKLPELLKVRHD